MNADKLAEVLITYRDGFCAPVDVAKAIDDLVKARVRVSGKPGTGACICRLPPDRNRDRHNVGYETDALNSAVDHRCSLHGERAQPNLWGRHTDLELIVTREQWDALGITHEVKE